FFFFSSRRRHTRSKRDWSSDVCSSDLPDCIIEKDVHVVRCILEPNISRYNRLSRHFDHSLATHRRHRQSDHVKSIYLPVTTVLYTNLNKCRSQGQVSVRPLHR